MGLIFPRSVVTTKPVTSRRAANTTGNTTAASLSRHPAGKLRTGTASNSSVVASRSRAGRVIRGAAPAPAATRSRSKPGDRAPPQIMVR